MQHGTHCKVELEPQLSSVKARVRSRFPSPQIFATAILRFSYRIEHGTPPKNANAETYPSRNDSVVSLG